MKITKPNIVFSNYNCNFLKSLVKIFNIKKNFLKIEYYKDGEFKIEFLKNYSGKSIFIFQSLHYPIHNNLIKLFLLIDALKRNFIKNIYLIIPYFCYSRQDKLFSMFTSISLKVITNLIDYNKIKKIITIDSHNNNFECFLNTPIKILKSTSLIVNDIILKNIFADIIISPDIGGISRAKNVANYMNLELVIIDKRRPLSNNVKIYCIIGSVKNKNCIIIDDIIDTSNSIIQISNFLLFYNIKKITVYITHALFSNRSYNKIINSCINELIISDTIFFNNNFSKIRILTTKFLFIEEIKKIILEEYEI